MTLSPELGNGRIVGPYPGASLGEPAAQLERRRPSQRVGVGLVGQTQDGDGDARETAGYLDDLLPKPLAMLVIAGENRAQQRRRHAPRGTEALERAKVARERAAGERRAWSQIRSRPDSRLALERALDVLSVGAVDFTEPSHLVDERDGRRQERVEGVLRHLG